MDLFFNQHLKRNTFHPLQLLFPFFLSLSLPSPSSSLSLFFSSLHFACFVSSLFSPCLFLCSFVSLVALYVFVPPLRVNLASCESLPALANQARGNAAGITKKRLFLTSSCFFVPRVFLEFFSCPRVVFFISLAVEIAGSMKLYMAVSHLLWSEIYGPDGLCRPVVFFVFVSACFFVFLCCVGNLSRPLSFVPLRASTD